MSGEGKAGPPGGSSRAAFPPSNRGRGRFPGAIPGGDRFPGPAGPGGPPPPFPGKVMHIWSSNVACVSTWHTYLGNDKDQGNSVMSHNQCSQLDCRI